MYVTQTYPGHLFHASRSFASLMELYEQNYMALRCLCPHLPVQGDIYMSAPPGVPRLYLKLLERQKYTSSLELTHCFRVSPDEATESPSLGIRVYHDARLAEVLMTHKVDRLTPKGQDSELKIRWSANRFLNRWLHYCLRQGYAFPPGDHVVL